ncbi:TonB-dependent siderophore receptor, partial [Variovorax sp. J2P1-59]|nr:TonB-dependent siderophore receptor [Variovorax sp. J2P1-59]
MKFPVTVACLLVATSSSIHAQDVGTAPTLGEVTVTTPRGVEPVFDVAGSVDRVEGSDIRDMRLQAQLSEGLSAVPGLQIQNRQNLAQDLQISIRG